MRFIKIGILASLFFLSLALNAQTQKPKIGYTNIELIVSLMPEAKAMQAQLKTHEDKLMQSIEVKKSYFQAKLEEYNEQKKSGKLKPEEIGTKESELQKLQTEIQKSVEDAENNFQRKKEELLGPILDKLQKAIDEVYAAEGYDYIFNSNASGTSILIKGPDQDNITLKVLAKLGVEPPKEILDQLKGLKTTTGTKN